MIQLNVVSRFSEDKNSFFLMLYALYKLKARGLEQVRLLFIGDIISESLYQQTLKLASIFKVSQQVAFTKKSIRYLDLPYEVKQGYFLNFTVGNFIGYSGLESINYGLKSIFLNADDSLTDITAISISQCNSIDSLIDLIINLIQDKEKTDDLIIADNFKLKQTMSLLESDATKLLSILRVEKN